MEGSLKDNILDLLSKIKHIVETPFYQRRKSAIKKYTEVLHELNEECNIILNKACGVNAWTITSKYNNQWAIEDFYKDKIKFFASLLYNYTPSLEYHRYKKICEEVLDLCIKKIQPLHPLCGLTREMHNTLMNINTKLIELQTDTSSIRYI